MPGSVEDLWVRLGANISGYVAGMETAGAAAGRFDVAQLRAQGHARAGWASAGVGLAAFGVATAAAGVAVVGYAIHNAIAMQTMMERLHTMGSITQAEVGSTTKTVYDLGTATGMSGTQIAEALYHPISIGFTLKESLQQVKYAAEESKLSGANLDDTMYSLTSTMKALNVPATSAYQTMGMLHSIVHNGDTKFQDFNESVKNLMPSLGSMGISLQSGGAALDYLTDRGNKADVASTRLTMGLALMSAPTKQAAKYLSALGLSSSEVTAKSADTANALKKAGLSTTQLSDDLRKPDGIAVALIDLRTHLHNAGVTANESDAIISKIFGGGRTDKGIVNLMQNLDGPGGLTDKFKLVGRDANRFGQDWIDVQTTAAFQIDAWKAKLGNSLGEIGTKMLPAVGRALYDLGKVFDWLGQHTGVLQALGAALAGVVATGLGIAAVAAWTLLAPFLAIAVPIAVVSVALFELYKHSQTFRDLVKAAMNVMKEGVIAAFHEVQRIIKAAEGWWKEHGAQVKFVAENLLRKAFTYISEGVKWTADRVKEALKFAEQWWHQHGAQVKSLIETVLVKSFHAIVTAVEWAVDQVKKALKFATVWWHDHGRQVKEAIGLIWNVVKVGIGLIVAFFEWAWPYIKIIVDTAWKLIKDIVRGAIKIVSDVIGTFIDLLTGNWGKLWDDVKKLVGDAFEAVKGIFRDFGTGALRLLYQAGKDVIQGLINGIKDMGGAIGGAIGDVASGAVNMAKHFLGIGSPSKVFHEIGMNLGRGLATALTRAPAWRCQRPRGSRPLRSQPSPSTRSPPGQTPLAVVLSGACPAGRSAAQPARPAAVLPVGQM